jgi:hypothetical protein
MRIISAEPYPRYTNIEGMPQILLK